MDSRWDKVQRVEMREIVIDYIFSEDKYSLSIASNFAYLFKAMPTSDGTRPGWLSQLRFDSVGDALAYGDRIIPIIRQAHVAQGYKNEAFHTLTDVIYAEHGKQQGFAGH